MTDGPLIRTPPRRPPPGCPFSIVWLLCALSVGTGGATGWLLYEALYPPLPWIAAHHVEVIDANTVATTIYLHIDGIAVPSLDRQICDEETLLAERARARVQGLLGQGSVRVKITHENSYGQVDALFVGADRPVREILLREGLARLVNPKEPARWCPNERPRSGLPEGSQQASLGPAPPPVVSFRNEAEAAPSRHWR